MADPVIVHKDDREWETWPEADAARRGGSRWKTLISGNVTPSEALTLGVSTLAPGGALHEHRHTQDEVYLVLEGSGLVRVGDEELTVGAGSAVFIPGDALHSCENTGTSDLRVAYVFPADSFEDVEYVFEG